MANDNINVGPLLPLIEGVALDLIGWWRRRQAEGQEPPTDAEVVARAQAKAKAIVDEGTAALQEFPEGS
jgi:hypothetical protein